MNNSVSISVTHLNSSSFTGRKKQKHTCKFPFVCSQQISIRSSTNLNCDICVAKTKIMI